VTSAEASLTRSRPAAGCKSFGHDGDYDDHDHDHDDDDDVDDDDDDDEENDDGNDDDDPFEGHKRDQAGHALRHLCEIGCTLRDILERVQLSIYSPFMYSTSAGVNDGRRERGNPSARLKLLILSFII
jgi:hypothetical protein